MTDLPATIPEPRRNASKHDPKRRISAKARAAVEAMVWDGLNRREAAEKCGLTDHGLYAALRTPAVKSYYFAELEVLRTSEKARNVHALIDVRDQRDNHIARVNAIKALEHLSDEASNRPMNISIPGFIIVVPGAAPIEQTKTIEHEENK